MPWLLPLMLAFATSGVQAPQPEPVRQKQVLVIYPTRKDAQIVAIGDREVPRILASRVSEGVDYYSEVIDPRQFSTA